MTNYCNKVAFLSFFYLKSHLMKIKYQLVLPEIILIIICIYWLFDNYVINRHFNFIAFSLFFILLFQLVFRNKYIGFFLSTLIYLFSFYMVLAVLSEFKHFKSIDSGFIQLIGFGFLVCFLMFSASILMFYNYLTKVF